MNNQINDKGVTEWIVAINAIDAIESSGPDFNVRHNAVDSLSFTNCVG